MMDIEHILNDALNKALCSKNRIQRPNSNNIAEFVSDYLKAINYTHCCTEFFCEDEDLEYSSKKCKEQCSGCKWIENL